MSTIYPQPSAPYGYGAYNNPPPYNPQSYKPDFPPVYQNPYSYERPPAYEPPLAYQAPNSAPQATVGRNADFEKDNCCICLSPLSDAADDEEDVDHKFEVAKTKCDHYFHNFCINKHLTDGVNQNCPLCRTELHATEISVIKLGKKQEPQAQNQTVETAKATSNIASDTLNGLGNAIVWSAKFGGRTLGYIGSALINTICPPATVQMAEQQSADVIRKLNLVNKDLKTALDNQKEYISVLIASINSLSVNNPDAAYHTFKRVDRALDAVKVQFERAQEELNSFLAKEQAILEKA